ncbi:MAG: hypothetical protein KF802_10020 [Bdellovibrionaceae bacterium]|nr:hypothetical protein [Pseudobdellovibrionaceae bacterium]MBX3033747.1 hypothetical protein [Pseudobdellovibrionaceae bacterium]
MVKCPRCGIEVTELHAVDSDLVSKLQSMGESSLPAQICAGCLSDLRKTAGRATGGALLAQERAKEQHRLQLWKNRVQLIKRARTMMSEKNYSEAAVSYEKYLKILEIVFGCKKGQFLTPEMFKDNARTSELTVVASVYWDLLRIYDTSDKYAERQQIAARQLAQFVRFTPIFPDIIKKAEAFVRQSRNPAIIKSFLKGAAEQRPRCFIATSAFESPWALEVQLLRHFRDSSLKPHAAGRLFIRCYEKTSPAIARFLDRNDALKPLIRAVLRFAVKRIS